MKNLKSILAMQKGFKCQSLSGDILDASSTQALQCHIARCHLARGSSYNSKTAGSCPVRTGPRGLTGQQDPSPTPQPARSPAFPGLDTEGWLHMGWEPGRMELTCTSAWWHGAPLQVPCLVLHAGKMQPPNWEGWMEEDGEKQQKLHRSDRVCSHPSITFATIPPPLL